MSNYEIYYWSTDGAVEVTSIEVTAASPSRAIDILKKKLVKAHPGMKFQYRCYNASIAHGDIHT